MAETAAAGSDVRRILLVVAVTCAALPAVLGFFWLRQAQLLFPDFFGFWCFGRFALTHSPAAIYDSSQLYAFEAQFGMPTDSWAYPFWYPPWLLLLLMPFGAMPFAAAMPTWLLTTFAAYAASVSLWRWPRVLALVFVLAPASIIGFTTGQNGFLSGALMLGGLRLLRSHPFLAGCLLAALAYKPQLAFLMPFVLLFGRHWRAMAGAACTAAVLSLITSIILGFDIWFAWIDSMRAQAVALTAGNDALREMMPTVTAATLLMGASTTVAHLVQIAGCIVGIAAIWMVRGRRDIEALAVVPVATLLSTPYAFHYDLTVVTGAALFVIAARIAAGGSFRMLELPALLACVMVPILQIAHVRAASIVFPLVMLATLTLLVGRTRHTVECAPLFHPTHRAS